MAQSNQKNILSIQDGLNIYSAYQYLGAKHAAVVTATLAADNFLHNKFGVEKHLLSSSAFWGKVAYHAISKIHTSELSFTTKVLLYTLSTGIATYMAYKGSDMFKDKHDWGMSAKAIKLTASFFDDNGVIDGLSEEWDKGYSPAIKYAWKYKKALAGNKFVTHSLLEQATHLTKLFITHKVLGAMPSRVDLLLALKNNDGILNILKLAGKEGASQLINKLYSKIQEKFQQAISLKINIKMAELALKPKNTAAIMHLGEDIQQLPQNLDAARQESSTAIKTLTSTAIEPLLYSGNNDTSSIGALISTYPSMILLTAMMNEMISDSRIIALAKFIEGFIYSTPSSSTNKRIYTETTTQKLGGVTINITESPDHYTFQNIQEIAKLNGVDFMRSLVLEYYNKKDDSTSTNMTIITADSTIVGAVLVVIRSTCNSLIFTLQLPALNISEHNISSVEYDLSQLSELIKESVVNEYNKQSIESAISTLHILKTYKSGVDRTDNNEMTLKVSGYKLTKDGSEIAMLDILELPPITKGIHAIYGPVGTGKTSFLTDIAECLAKGLHGSGSVMYPTIDGHRLPMIFCGSKVFAPPRITLFQSLTYRIPEKFTVDHKIKLQRETYNLLRKFLPDINHEWFGVPDTDLGDDTLSSKFNELRSKYKCSTGQEQIMTIVSGLLYKIHINTPVLFVMDETLANLDRGNGSTLEKVFLEITSLFADSIVLFVDHGWRQYEGFYTNSIDLKQYRFGEIAEQVPELRVVEEQVPELGAVKEQVPDGSMKGQVWELDG